MQLLHPTMLATLGLIPVLIAIHALKPKHRRVEAANLFLWQALLDEGTRRMRFRRLRHNLPLMLQIFIVMLAALALAEPARLSPVPKSGNIILVVDTSASMKTRGARGTRFDAARQKALEIIAQRRPHQKILIIAAGPKPMLPAGFLENSKETAAIVRDLSPTDAVGNLEAALYLALSFVDPSSDDRIYLITDGCGADPSALLQRHPRITPVIVSGGKHNIGITRFDFRQEVSRTDHYEILLEIKNFDDEPIECPVRLSIDNTTILDSSLNFAPQEKKVLIFPYSGIIGGLAKAMLDVADDFATDNTASLALTAAKEIWVLLVSRGNYFLETLLSAYPNVRVNSVSSITASSWDEQTTRHDIVIIDHMDFPATSKGNLFLIDSYSPSIPIARTGDLDFPQILDWDRNSPLTADVDLGGLAIEQAARVRSAGMSPPLIEASQTGLLYTYEKEGLRAVFLGLDIAKSNLPLKVAFPVMISNIINWLNPGKLSFSSLQAKAGEPYEIYLKPETRDFYLRRPYQKWQKQHVSANPFVFLDTHTAGIYTILENGKQNYFTVNLLDEQESDIARSWPQLKFTPSQGREDDSAPMTTRRSLWAFFLLAALGVLLLEWYAWLKSA
jgi:Ca-activated chloride channel family protein